MLRILGGKKKIEWALWMVYVSTSFNRIDFDYKCAH